MFLPAGLNLRTFNDLFGTLVVDLFLRRVGRQHAVEHVGFTLSQTNTETLLTAEQ